MMMSGSSEFLPATNACLSCSRGKRKCDRARPICSTCARGKRECIYEGDPRVDAAVTESRLSQPVPVQPQDRVSGALPGSSRQASADHLISGVLLGLDANRDEVFQRHQIDATIRIKVSQIMGNVDEFQATIAEYFDTVHNRLPIVAKERFYDRLGTLLEIGPADLATLCLCMRLILRTPTPQSPNMQSTLYLIIKSIITLLESTNYLSIEVLQCRLIICFYEIGHGISPANSISIGACSRMARALGLNKSWAQQVRIEVPSIIEEERMRVWWAVFNLDRFINLHDRDALFGTEDPRLQDLLPVDNESWVRNVLPSSTLVLTLETSSDTTIGQFARECQVSYLTGRVLRHVFDPISDLEFHASEELQLERTLKSFMRLLMEEDSKYGQYCTALAICTSALFNLYDAALQRYPENDLGKDRIVACMESASIRLTDFATHLFEDLDVMDIRFMSPLIPNCLHQAAVVQFRSWKQSNEIFCRRRVDSLKRILGHFKRRWQVAEKYIADLEVLEREEESAEPGLLFRA